MTLTDDHLRALGRVTANFGQLELLAGHFIAALISPRADVGRIITSKLSFRNTLDVLDALFRNQFAADPDALAEFERILKQVATAEEQRNRLIHSGWVTSSDSPQSDPIRLKFTARRGRGLRADSESLTVKDIDMVADAVRASAESLIQFLTKLAKARKIHVEYSRTTPDADG
jgi:hypothetical protein